MNSLISIVVPCFNKAPYIEDTLQSVQAQSYKNWECIIVNDGSTDNSEDIVQRFIQGKNQFQYLKTENHGVSVARNTGIKSSKGRFLLPLDADDIIHKDYLNICLQVFDNEPDADIVYTNSAFFGDKNEERKLPEFSIKNMLLRNMVYCAAVYRRKVFETIGGYSPDFIKGSEDWDFWISALESGFRFFKSPETYFYYRRISDSRDRVFKKDLSAVEEVRKIIIKKHIEFYQEHLGSALTAYKEAEKYKKAIEKIHANSWFKFQFRLKNFLKTLV